jgi:uncharacterized protein (DUF1499 family)
VKRILITVLALLVVATGSAVLYGAWVDGSVLSWRRPANLGFGNGRLAPCRPTPNCVSSQAEPADREHYVEPIPFEGGTLDAMAAARLALRNMERVTIIEEGPNYLYAQARSRVLRFVDDVEFGYDPGRRLLHMRSASRLGRRDFGVNRERAEALRAAILAGRTQAAGR